MSRDRAKCRRTLTHKCQSVGNSYLATCLVGSCDKFYSHNSEVCLDGSIKAEKCAQMKIISCSSFTTCIRRLFRHDLTQPLSPSYVLLSALITLLRNIDESYIRERLLIFKRQYNKSVFIDYVVDLLRQRVSLSPHAT